MNENMTKALHMDENVSAVNFCSEETDLKQEPESLPQSMTHSRKSSRKFQILSRMSLSDNSPIQSLGQTRKGHAKMVGVPRTRIDTANVVDDDEDEEWNSWGMKGGLPVKEKFVSTLTRLRPLLTSYNSQESKPVQQLAGYNSPKKITSLAKLLTPAQVRREIRTKFGKPYPMTHLMNEIPEETEPITTTKPADNFYSARNLNTSRYESRDIGPTSIFQLFTIQ